MESVNLQCPKCGEKLEIRPGPVPPRLIPDRIVELAEQDSKRAPDTTSLLGEAYCPARECNRPFSWYVAEDGEARLVP